MLSLTAAALTAVAQAAEAHADAHVTFRIRRTNDLAVRWVAVDARPLFGADDTLEGWIGSTFDVTDETTAVAELRRFSEILEATPDLVAMVDTAGRFTYP